MPSIETTNDRRRRHRKKWYKFEPTEISAWIRVPFFIVCLLTWVMTTYSVINFSLNRILYHLFYSFNDILTDGNCFILNSSHEIFYLL